MGKKELSIEEVRSLQKRWLGIRSANLYDTLDKLGYPNQCLDLGIKPLEVGKRVAGRALTILGRRTPFTLEEIEKGLGGVLDFKLVVEKTQPCDVVVVDGAGEKLSGKFGEMTSWAVQQKGATGIVVDGYIRDYEGFVVIPDFTVCSRGTSSIESQQRWSICGINEVIGMPGTLSSIVRVAPGDWIVGDADSIIVVPQEIMYEALEAAEDVEAREEGMRQDMQNGMLFEDAFKKWGRA